MNGEGVLAVADTGNHTIRMVSTDRYELQVAASDGASVYVGSVVLEPPRAFGSVESLTEAFVLRDVTIRLSEAQSADVTLDWEPADAEVAAGADYVAASGNLAFPAGVTSKTVSILLLDDLRDEDTESFRVNLSKVTGVQNGGGATVRIEDDDPTPTLSIDDVTVTEGSGSFVDMVFSIRLSAASGRVVTCTIENANGTATVPADYLELKDSLAFAPGETLKTAVVKVVGDTTFLEGEETLFVNLGSPSGAILDDAQGVGTIVDDDEAITIADVAVEEGNDGVANASIWVTLMPASDTTVTVDYVTSGGSATSGAGFSPVGPATLTFLSGETLQTVTILIIGDAVPEPDETLSIYLSGASNAEIGDGVGIITIVDDDFGTPGGLNALATSGTSVSVTWGTVGHAAGYRVHRSSDGAGFEVIAATVAPAYVDATVTPATSYLYAVDAVGTASGLSVPDLATTVLFADPTIVPGVTKVRLVHVTQLRIAVNAVRRLAGQSESNFTEDDLSALDLIRSVHVSELREALGGGRAALGLRAVACTNPTLTPGITIVRAAHITELWAGVQ